MATAPSTLHVSGLGRQKLATLRQQAKTLGMSAEGYARHLIEEGISLERKARTKAFDELFAPARARFQKSGMSEDPRSGINALNSKFFQPGGDPIRLTTGYGEASP